MKLIAHFTIVALACYMLIGCVTSSSSSSSSRPSDNSSNYRNNPFPDMPSNITSAKDHMHEWHQQKIKDEADEIKGLNDAIKKYEAEKITSPYEIHRRERRLPQMKNELDEAKRKKKNWERAYEKYKKRESGTGGSEGGGGGGGGGGC